MDIEGCISFPVLGEPAPDFEAETTHGPITLSGHEGKMGCAVLPSGGFHTGLYHRVHGIRFNLR